ncbi:MAG TPA: cytochrome c family protein [Alphaproteobacteria bacterium]|nr:cytochrome c family protein [Alphaproteobacteria bacterium]
MRNLGVLKAGATIVLAFALPHVAIAAGDAAKGAKVFNQCKICHTNVQNKNAIGPSLFGVIGRKAGTEPGFSYSPAMKKAGEGGLVWSAETLDKYLSNPAAMIPGNKMTFAGLKKEDDREDVIAYLETLK